MIEHTFQVLEYYRLLELLSQYASSPLGRSGCRNLRPSSDLEYIDAELRRVAEVRLLLKTEGFVSFSDVEDISAVLRKSSARGAVLDCAELLSVLRLAAAGREARNFLKARRDLCPRMAELVEDLPIPAELIQDLNRSLETNGTLKDSASPGLKKIRRQKTRLRAELHKKLEKIHQSVDPGGESADHLVTVREGRYVISLRIDHRSRLEGIVHDYSQTRSTCFMEPLAVLEENNRLAELAREEKSEERKILLRLTGMVRERGDTLLLCQSRAARLDTLYARGRLGETLSCVMPEVGAEQEVVLKGARNPVLLGLALEKDDSGEHAQPPIAVDIFLERDRKILLVSGPNRGGKTVTLKTLGLLVLMTQCGMHIPAEEGSALPVFERIMADIGDEQDMRTGRSTFSAHAAYMKEILERSGAGSLVIIDEPGNGTDPNEGAALAMALLDHLSQQGSWVAVSTHLNQLKSYGVLNPSILNAAVEFDEQQHQPTFRVLYGAPGISYALEIAREMGLPAAVLERAADYLDKDEVRLNTLLGKINAIKEEAARQSEAAAEACRHYRQAAGRLEEQCGAMQAAEKEVLAAKRREAEAAISQAREELAGAINLLKSKQEGVQSQVTETYTRVSERLMQKFAGEGDSAVPAAAAEVRPGQWAYHRKLQQTGRVQAVDAAAGRVQLQMGNVKTWAAREEVQPAEAPGQNRGASISTPAAWKIGPAPGRELNVIGYRVEEALPLIDKTIDRALVDGAANLRIIHGFGTGKLREAIRSHLQELAPVKAIAGSDHRSGGDAITEVTLG